MDNHSSNYLVEVHVNSQVALNKQQIMSNILQIMIDSQKDILFHVRHPFLLPDGQEISIQYSSGHHCSGYAMENFTLDKMYQTLPPITEHSTFEVFYPGTEEPSYYESLDSIAEWIIQNVQI